MSRASGSPRVAVTVSQLIHTPDDMEWNARAYGLVEEVRPLLPISIEGYGMWSIYVSVTDPGATTMRLHIWNENDTADLATLVVSAAVTAGAVRHFTFGAPNTTVPVVARKIQIGLTASMAGQTATLRIFGRAY